MALVSNVPVASGVVLRTIGLLILFYILKFFYRLYRVRSYVRNVANKHGIPMLPHSFLFGHLIIVGKVMAKLPRHTSGLLVPLLLSREYPDLFSSGLAYMDMWPISPPMIAVFHPDIMAQFTQETSLPKHDIMQREFQPFTQCNDLVNQEGQAWKTWRSIFNPGFSAKNLLSFVPEMVEEILIFRDWLKAVAMSGEVAKLEDQATKVTIDVIGRAVLGARLRCQTTSNPFYHTIKNQIKWLITDNSPPSILKALNPFRPFIMWNNNRIMKNYLLPHILRGISEYGKIEGYKTVTNLAVKAYLNEVKSSSSSNNIDPRFIDMVIAQMKIFIFAGHDTTAGALSFAYYLLWKNPETLVTMRAEHDAVLGSDISKAAANITVSPQLLNKLPYTSAVIKETLRLFPPIGTVRKGRQDFFLIHPDTGIRYPTDGFMLFGCSIAEHRNVEFWPRPDDFVPDRWLVGEGDPMRVRKNAFRPFELGPRNCIGQELAQLELRAILALTVRELDIQSVYSESGDRVLNELAYQTLAPGEITGHPSQGMPVRVKIRN